MDESRRSLDAANAALDAVRELLRTCQHSLGLATAALEAVKQTYRVGAEAANLVARVGLDGAIAIRKISFNVPLSTADSGAFECSVRVSFAGQAKVTIDVAINLRNLTSIARELANRVVSGLADFL